MVAEMASIKLIGTEYVAFLHSKEISRGKSLLKVVTKLQKYIKSQS